VVWLVVRGLVDSSVVWFVGCLVDGYLVDSLVCWLVVGWIVWLVC
jgi:hypothetical protein